MLPYLKPFRETRSNIETLKIRGMIFADEDHAARCLARIGYYRLSAYWYPFRKFCSISGNMDDQVRCDCFTQDTTFEQVLDFYLFDKELRLKVSDALERIEIGIRAIIIEILGGHGSHAHRDPRSYNAWFTDPDVKTDESQMSNFLTGQDRAFLKSKEEFAKHFRRTYSGQPPIWIAAGGWDWGNLSYILSGLSDKNKISVCAEIDPRLQTKTLVSWVAALNEVRNACAHHSRLWNKVLTNSPSFQKSGNIAVFDHMRNAKGVSGDQHTKRLYGALMALMFLMKSFHPKTEWPARLAKWVAENRLPTEISVTAAGFPSNWREQELWAPPVTARPVL